MNEWNVKDKNDFCLDFDLWASYLFHCRGSFRTLMLVVATASG